MCYRINVQTGTRVFLILARAKYFCAFTECGCKCLSRTEYDLLLRPVEIMFHLKNVLVAQPWQYEQKRREQHEFAAQAEPGFGVAIRHTLIPQHDTLRSPGFTEI